MTATQDVRLESSAIILEGLQVEAEGGRCRVRPAQGLGVAELWDEARKALSAAAFTNREAVYLYRTTLYTRDLALDAKTIQREEQMTGSKLFDSKPAEDLIENGFVQSDGDGQLYFAPDADVLLSDPFLDSHCFRFTVGRGEAEGMVGLGFEPASRRNRNIDISGTLWLDGQTFELRWLQYNYENLDPDINSSEVGGHVEFQRLPNVDCSRVVDPDATDWNFLRYVGPSANPHHRLQADGRSGAAGAGGWCCGADGRRGRDWGD